ncbi:MAG: CfrBI family restriction endonuclease [Leptolyngbyaceae cyanobacterium SM1_4_3]|nr:CfrBI family restriction endonuclease [Leptolyngbyaceae cyanobacterium SM1_4_3]
MTTINDLFPEKGKLILTGGGRDFIEKLGVETVRQLTLDILCGENIRTQTEQLTSRRVAIAAGAMVALFAKGWAEVEDFTNQLSDMALSQLKSSRRSDNALIWPANWLIGLTGKGFQNVLRSNPIAQEKYIQAFEVALEEAAQKCEEDFGSIRMFLGVVEDEHGRVCKNLEWRDITRLTTAIGCLTLTIRGSDKSIYGKLFEKLVLGSVLHILGFEYVRSALSRPIERVFWLSDSSDVRECDATVRLRAGKIARFDIGFIGSGNSEIMKDKLTRFANLLELDGKTTTSQTFIIVDRMPQSTKTLESASRAGSEITQMSMQFWPQELARRLESRLSYRAEILDIEEEELYGYLAQKIESAPLLSFLNIDEILEEDADRLQVSLPDDSLVDISGDYGGNDLGFFDNE